MVLQKEKTGTIVFLALVFQAEPNDEKQCITLHLHFLLKTNRAGPLKGIESCCLYGIG